MIEYNQRSLRRICRLIYYIGYNIINRYRIIRYYIQRNPKGDAPRFIIYMIRFIAQINRDII